MEYFERPLCTKTPVGPLGSDGVSRMPSMNALSRSREQKLCLSEDCFVLFPQGQKGPAQLWV